MDFGALWTLGGCLDFLMKRIWRAFSVNGLTEARQSLPASQDVEASTAYESRRESGVKNCLTLERGTRRAANGVAGQTLLVGV